MISAVAETSGASIDEVKFHYYFFKILQRMENLPKNAFYSFCSRRWKYFKQTSL